MQANATCMDYKSTTGQASVSLTQKYQDIPAIRPLHISPAISLRAISLTGSRPFPKAGRSRFMCMCRFVGGCAGSVPAAPKGHKATSPVHRLFGDVEERTENAQRAFAQRRHLSRLHWGGGTPTLLQPGMMEELAGAIKEVAPFDSETEFSVEIDPNEIDGARLDALAAAGHEPRLDWGSGFSMRKFRKVSAV